MKSAKIWNPKEGIKEGKRRKKNRWNKKHNSNDAIYKQNHVNITLKVNGLNIPIKRQRLTEWIKKAKPNYIPSGRNSLYIGR